jgi:hypothetical protein
MQREADAGPLGYQRALRQQSVLGRRRGVERVVADHEDRGGSAHSAAIASACPRVITLNTATAVLVRTAVAIVSA